MMRLRSALFFISVIFVFFVLFGISSCTGPERLKETYSTESEKVLPPKKELPVIQILDYKNRNEGAAPSLWLRSYLENGITGPESFTVYRGNYLFIAYTRSNIRPVINQWMGNYSIDRDFSRLVADRIQRRLEQNLPALSPGTVYGSNYDRTIKAAYDNAFWGGRRLDDTWVYGLSPTINETELRTAAFWGFILLSIPRETLEIQITELLSKITNSAAGDQRTSKEQNTSFDAVKNHFFETF